MKKFTVISVYNNRQLLQNCLNSSVESQVDVDVELKYVDNSDGRYPNAKVAFESVLDNCGQIYSVFSSGYPFHGR